jgi:hypothetical protein
MMDYMRQRRKLPNMRLSRLDDLELKTRLWMLQTLYPEKVDSKAQSERAAGEHQH